MNTRLRLEYVKKKVVKIFENRQGRVGILV